MFGQVSWASYRTRYEIMCTHKKSIGVTFLFLVILNAFYFCDLLHNLKGEAYIVRLHVHFSEIKITCLSTDNKIGTCQSSLVCISAWDHMIIMSNRFENDKVSLGVTNLDIPQLNFN